MALFSQTRDRPNDDELLLYCILIEKSNERALRSVCRRQNLVCFVCFSFVSGVSFVVLVSFVLWHFLYMLCSLAYFISSVRA